MAPHNPERTQTRLLDAAEKEFSMRGFAGARVASIARAARTNQRMVYHYFGSKQGLYRTVFERRGRKSMDAMLSELSIDSSEEPLMAYRHILGVQFDLFARNPTYARMSAHEALDGFIRGFDPAKDPQTRFLAQTAPFFQKALAKKLFRDPAGPFNGMALASFLGLCFVLYRKRIEDLLQRLGREEADLAASYRETVLDTILHGLLATEFRD